MTNNCYICEKCGKPVDAESFVELSQDKRYQKYYLAFLDGSFSSLCDEEISFGIVHRYCAVADGAAESIFIHKTHNNLALVEIAWKKPE